MSSSVLAKNNSDDHGQAVDVSPVVIVLRVGLFGRAEDARANAAGVEFVALFAVFFFGAKVPLLDGGGLVLAKLLGESKINNLAGEFVVQYNVLELDVSVDDVLVVYIAEPLDDLEYDAVVFNPFLLEFGLTFVGFLVAEVNVFLKRVLAKLRQNVYSDLLEF